MDEKAVETVMAAVCDICHWPYVETNQEILEERCAVCPVERILKEMEANHGSDT